MKIRFIILGLLFGMMMMERMYHWGFCPSTGNLQIFSVRKKSQNCPNIPSMITKSIFCQTPHHPMDLYSLARHQNWRHWRNTCRKNHFLERYPDPVPPLPLPFFSFQNQTVLSEFVLTTGFSTRSHKKTNILCSSWVNYETGLTKPQSSQSWIWRTDSTCSGLLWGMNRRHYSRPDMVCMSTMS